MTSSSSIMEFLLQQVQAQPTLKMWMGWIWYVLSVLFLKALKFYAATIPLFALASIHQEYKIWKKPPKNNKTNDNDDNDNDSNSNSPKDNDNNNDDNDDNNDNNKIQPLSWYGMLKVWGFNVVWMMGALLVSLLSLPLFLVFSSQKVQFLIATYPERWLADFIRLLFVGPVVVKGREHLPPLPPPNTQLQSSSSTSSPSSQPKITTTTTTPSTSATTTTSSATTPPTPPTTSASASTTTNKNDSTTTTSATTTASTTTTSASTTASAPIYIANHSSQIDLCVVYNIHRRFKWIAKSSVLWLPGVGQMMLLSGHIFINRQTGKNKKSVDNLYTKSKHSLEKEGVAMFLFPEGTRRMADRLKFKNGAFVMAQESKSTLIPMSIDIPPTTWNSWYPMTYFLSIFTKSNTNPIVITIHPPIPVTGKEDREELKQQCFDIIYSVLPDYRAAADNNNNNNNSRKEEEETKKEK